MLHFGARSDYGRSLAIDKRIGEKSQVPIENSFGVNFFKSVRGYVGGDFAIPRSSNFQLELLTGLINREKRLQISLGSQESTLSFDTNKVNVEERQPATGSDKEQYSTCLSIRPCNLATGEASEILEAEASSKEFFEEVFSTMTQMSKNAVSISEKDQEQLEETSRLLTDKVFGGLDSNDPAADSAYIKRALHEARLAA